MEQLVIKILLKVDFQIFITSAVLVFNKGNGNKSCPTTLTSLKKGHRQNRIETAIA